jgi:hypothetical protein
MTEKEQIELSWKLLQNNQNMIKFADSKIQFLLVISGITTTYILTNLKDLLSFGIYSKIFIVGFLIASLLFVIFALLTIYPRHASKTGISVPKLLYHGHVSERIEVGDYINEFSKADEKEILKDILYQVYEVSNIATKKFKFYDKSWRCLGAQLIAFVIIIIIKSL